ncbi:hypothetical protein CMI47_02145 [Candidatus Pacearchaeota archaeon]|nr:hypothetical protein [Candidatus Pacearchaeota archaeon]|tara:strand:+ start:6633 stop:6824 length:192 start_codon:yes stop_codon:yes gene_type:complete
MIIGIRSTGYYGAAGAVYVNQAPVTPRQVQRTRRVTDRIEPVYAVTDNRAVGDDLERSLDVRA